MISRATDFGVVGDDTGTQQAAINAAAASVAAAGGGILSFAPGRYRTTGAVEIPSYVRLVAECPGTATIHLDPPDATYGVVMRDVGAAGLEGVDVECESAVAGVSAVLLERADSCVVRHAHLRGAKFSGLLCKRSPDVVIDLVEVSDIPGALNAQGALLGGTGIWIFDGCQRARVTRTAVLGVGGSAIWLDAGTTSDLDPPSSFQPCTDCQLSDLIVDGFAQLATGSALALHGAQRCTVQGAVLKNSPLSYASYGVTLQEDQNAIPTTDCVVSDVFVADVGSAAVQIMGSSRNTVRARAHNATRALPSMPAGSRGYAVLLQDNYSLRTGYGLAKSPCEDNLVEIAMVIDAGVGRYEYGALFLGTTASPCRRNRVVGRLGTPTLGVANLVGTQSENAATAW